MGKGSCLDMCRTIYWGLTKLKGPNLESYPYTTVDDINPARP